MQKKTWKDRLKETWDERPLECIVVGIAVVGCGLGIIETVSSARSKSAYARQINRKEKARYPYS